jgi:hypothetical protein
VHQWGADQVSETNHHIDFLKSSSPFNLFPFQFPSSALGITMRFP